MRLRWAGHVSRLDDTRMVKKLMDGRPDGRRPLGRPKKRWEDNVKETLSSLGLRDTTRWRDLTGNRVEWRNFVVAVKDGNGLAPLD